MGDVLLNAPLTGGMLPSPSVLTGNYRPQTAAAYMEQTLAEAKARAAGSRLGTPALPQTQTHPQPQAQQKGSVVEVSALRSMASRHLGHLRQTPPSPYTMQQPPLPSRCLSTPPLRSQPATPPPPPTPLLLAPQPPSTPTPPPQQQQQQQHPLQVSFDLAPRDLSAPAASGGGGPAAPTSRPGGLHHSARLGVSISVSGGGAAPAAAGSAADTAGAPDSPTAAFAAVPAAVTASGAAPCTSEGLMNHPTYGMITTCSSHPLFTAHQTLPRLALPADGLVVAAAAPTMTTTPLASPVAALLAGGGGGSGCPASGAATPHGGRPAPSQPHPLSPAQAAAAAAPPPLLPPQQQPSPHGAAHPHPHAQSMPRFFSHSSPHSSRPSTSISVQDLCLPRPGTRYPSRSPTRGSMTQILDLSRTGSASSGGAATTSSSRVPTAASFGSARLSSPASLTQHPGGGDAASAAGASTGVVATPGRGATRFNHAVTRWASEAAAGQGGGEAARVTRGGFKVTRGMLYSVFQELDEFDSGRLTYSAFEQAACKIGMRPVQAKRLFEHLDPQSRGFATMREWNSPHLQRQMEAFTRLYVQATRGSDGRPKDITEVRSMHMAIQMAMVKLQLKRCGRAVSLDRLVQAFAYMDRDSNGALNAEEVEDALNSLGIFVTPEVVDTIMRTFDKDGNGAVDYYEFVKSLYPTLDTGVYQQ